MFTVSQLASEHDTNQCLADMCAATTAQHSETLSPDLDARFGKFVSANPQPQIILGTQSVSRRAVVDQLAQKFSFKVSSITADIDEKAIRTPDPKDLVMLLAHAKADAILKKLKDSGSFIQPGYLVTCDQVLSYFGDAGGDGTHLLFTTVFMLVSQRWVLRCS